MLETPANMLIPVVAGSVVAQLKTMVLSTDDYVVVGVHEFLFPQHLRIQESIIMSSFLELLNLKIVFCSFLGVVCKTIFTMVLTTFLICH